MAIRRFLIQIENIDTRETDGNGDIDDGTKRHYTVSALLINKDINEGFVESAFDRDFSFSEGHTDIGEGLKEAILQELFGK